MADKRKITDYMHVSGWSAKVILRNLPFVFFLGLLATLYIANSHYALKTIREIKVKQDKLRELRWNYMTIQSDLMWHNKHSEVVKKVKELDLNIQSQKPKKILVEKQETKTNSKK